jgi:hypothetical protein
VGLREWYQLSATGHGEAQKNQASLSTKMRSILKMKGQTGISSKKEMAKSRTNQDAHEA